MNRPKCSDPINKLNSCDQSIIFQLRTIHIPHNNCLKRIGVRTSSACLLCNCQDETVEHHLFECVRHHRQIFTHKRCTQDVQNMMCKYLESSLNANEMPALQNCHFFWKTYTASSSKSDQMVVS